MNFLSRLMFKRFSVSCNYSVSSHRFGVSGQFEDASCSGTFTSAVPKVRFSERALHCGGARLEAELSSPTGYVLRKYPTPRTCNPLEGYPFPKFGEGSGVTPPSYKLSRWEYDADGLPIQPSQFALIDAVLNGGTNWFPINANEYPLNDGDLPIQPCEIIRIGYPPTWPFFWNGSGNPDINNPTQWEPEPGYSGSVFATRAAFCKWLDEVVGSTAPAVLYSGAPNDLSSLEPFFDATQWAKFQSLPHGLNAGLTGNDFSQARGVLSSGNSLPFYINGEPVGELGYPPINIGATVPAIRALGGSIDKYGQRAVTYDPTGTTTLYGGGWLDAILQAPYYANNVTSLEKQFAAAGYSAQWYIQSAWTDLYHPSAFSFGDATGGYQPVDARITHGTNTFSVEMSGHWEYEYEQTADASVTLIVSWENL